VRQNDAHRDGTMYVARQLDRNSVPKTGIAPSRPISQVSNRHTFQVFPSVSVKSVRLPSVPSVFQSFDVPTAAKTHFPIFEMNVNH
jgi:hypothetical protein